MQGNRVDTPDFATTSHDDIAAFLQSLRGQSPVVITPQENLLGQELGGFAAENIGSVVSMFENVKEVVRGWPSPPRGPHVSVVAHEIGHFVGYDGGPPEDVYHSADPRNIMYPSLHDSAPYADPSSVVDECWCKKMYEASKENPSD